MLEEGERRALRPGAATPTELGRSSALEGFVPRRRRTETSDGSGIAETAPSRDTARRDAVFRRLLALADVLAAIVAIVVGGALLEADLVNGGSIVALPLIVFAAKTLGL
jgi:hypothetical protein